MAQSGCEVRSRFWRCRLMVVGAAVAVLVAGCGAAPTGLVSEVVGDETLTGSGDDAATDADSGTDAEAGTDTDAGSDADSATDTDEADGSNEPDEADELPSDGGTSPTGGELTLGQACAIFNGAEPAGLDLEAFGTDDDLARLVMEVLYDSSAIGGLNADSQTYVDRLVDMGSLWFETSETVLADASAATVEAQRAPGVDLDTAARIDVGLGSARCGRELYEEYVAVDAPLGRYTDISSLGKSATTADLDAYLVKYDRDADPADLSVEDACKVFDPESGGLEVWAWESDVEVFRGANVALRDEMLRTAENDITSSAAWYVFEYFEASDAYQLAEIGSDDEAAAEEMAILADDALAQFDYMLNRGIYDSVVEFLAPCGLELDEVMDLGGDV